MFLSRVAPRAHLDAPRLGATKTLRFKPSAVVALALAFAALLALSATDPANAQVELAEAPEEWAPVQLTQAGASPTTQFGSEIATDGELTAVQGDGTYVFTSETGAIPEKLTDRQGYLAVSDGRILLGAYNDAVYLYERNEAGWSETVVIEGIVGPVGFHRDRLVVVGIGSGALYVFDEAPDGSWIPDRIGSGFLSLAASDDRIVVGKISATVQNPAGVVTMFTPRADGSFETSALLPSDSRPNDTFGWSIDMDGDRVAVGTNNKGKAYVYAYDEVRGWVEHRLPVPRGAFGTNGSAFGADVAIIGDRAVIGSPNGLIDATSGASSAVYTFRPNALKIWLHESTLPNPGGSAGFGLSVDASPNSIAVGSPHAGDGSGRSFVFTSITPEPTMHVLHAVSCLAGSGRVDTNLVNVGSEEIEYRVQFEGLSPRARTVEAGDWWRTPITGRPNGDYRIVVTRAGETVSDRTVTVGCDLAAPQVTTDEVQVVNACRGGLGYVLFQLVNPTLQSRPYIIEFAGVPNRSTTAAALGGTVRATTARPDGVYGVTIRSGSQIVETLSVEVDCKAD